MHRVWRGLAQLVLSGVGAAVVIGVGCAALFVSSAPKWVSLAIEPLSLLLTPGVAFSMLFTKSHDYTEMEILRGAFGFYFVLLYGLLVWRGRMRVWSGRRGTREAATTR